MRVAIINDTRPTSHYGCLMVMKNLEVLLQQQGIEVVWTWPVSIDWRKHKSEILNKPQVDAVIVNGEGTIHHGPRRWQAQALAEFAEYAHDELKIPAFLINSTLYANNASLYEHLAFYDAIYVRDRASHNELNTFKIENIFVPDMTFAVSSNLESFQRKPICVVDSVMQKDVPFLKGFGKKHHADYCSMIVARPTNYSFWKRPRKYLLETIKWMMGERHRSLNPKAFESYLGQYQLVVTGRYHTVTMCLKNRVPFLALESNTPKISYLLKEVFGNTRRVISAKELNAVKLDDWNTYSNNEMEAIDTFLKRAECANFEMIQKIVVSIKNVSVQV
jgi:polysaccharide pyruvyl transferase WcaK-like protein